MEVPEFLQVLKYICQPKECLFTQHSTHSRSLSAAPPPEVRLNRLAECTCHEMVELDTKIPYQGDGALGIPAYPSFGRIS